MNKQELEAVVREVMDKLNPPGDIPLGVSARHCHLSEELVSALFGKGYVLTPKRSLSQPGQFAAEETVGIAGPKGAIHHVRILGPARSMTQVEVSLTDARQLGIDVPVRLSGDLEGAPGVTIIGPHGSRYIPESLIVAKAHIHMTPDDAKRLSVTNGQSVGVTGDGQGRRATFHDVTVRVSERYRLEMHVDTDEANAAGLQNGSVLRLGKPG